jgi:hypothetical protein
MAYAYGVSGAGGCGGSPELLTRALQRSARPVRSLLPVRSRRAQPVPQPPPLNVDEILALSRRRRVSVLKRRPRARLSAIEYALASPAERNKHDGWLADLMRRTTPPRPRDRKPGRGWVAG